MKRFILCVLTLILALSILSGCGSTESGTPAPQSAQSQTPAEPPEVLLQKALAGKGLSILGDSISTFSGWSDSQGYNYTLGENKVYYTGTGNFLDVNETWWMQAIKQTGMDIVVNNSYSGDWVMSRGAARALELHDNSNRVPDIIAVYLGINDFRHNADPDSFRQKYDEMISGMVAKYDKADVYLFTLVYTTDVQPGVDPGNLVTYNAIISEIAAKYDCTVVDLYKGTGIDSDNLAQYMVDGDLHPNYDGMDLITDCFVKALMENYL